MKTNKQITCLMSLVIFFFFQIPMTTSAEELNVAVHQVRHEQQRDNSNYFNLLVNPGEKGVIQLKMENTSSKEVTVDLNLTTSTTNSKGNIEYTKKNATNEPTEPELPNFFEKETQKVTLKKKERKTIDFNYTIPEEPFDGTILGAVHIKERKKEQETFGFAFSQVIAIQMQESEEPVALEFELNELKIDTYEQTAAILVEIKNKKPVVLKNMSFSGEVAKKKSKRIHFDFLIENYSMAPNSTLLLPIPIPDDIGIDVGDYTLDLKINDEGRRYDLSKEFSVTKQDLERIKLKEEDKPKTNYLKPLVIIIALLFGVVLLITTVLLTRKRAKK